MDSAAQVEGFLDKFGDEIAELARKARARLKQLLPGAVEMVYDNYNALVFGFGAVERPSAAIISLAVYRDHVSLCFLFGIDLPDPRGLLRGGGNRVRHIRLPAPETLDEPDVAGLIAEAVSRSEPPFDPSAPGRLVIRSVSARQRPRR